MSYFSSNIKLLRKRRGRTQDDVAFTLGMKRPTLSGYENGVAQPHIEALVAFSDYFKIAVDTLIKTDLTILPESQLLQLERGFDVFIRGGNLRILATTVDAEEDENIELVSEKAKAGYRTGFADPEYIRILPAFHLPFLSKQKKYRTFQIVGDSMIPIPDGAWVTGEFLQDWLMIRNRQAYIILTIDEGIVFKVAENKIETDGILTLHSLNPLYPPYDIHVNDIKEVWKFVNYISAVMPDASTNNDQIFEAIRNLQSEVRNIQNKMMKEQEK